jgi:glycosyltransferase involved in cell wall biosynthesis
MEELKYSVLLPVYIKDNPEWFRIAVESMVNQTLPPDEILIAADGPVTEELEEIIRGYEANTELFTVLRYDVNVGRGALSKKVVPLCRNEYIARMDSDDYSLPGRCEAQMKFLAAHPDIGVCGTYMNEFIGGIENVVSRRKVPETHEEILRFAKRRFPVNNPTLIYRKSDILAAGNYSDLRNIEDYDMIIRMLHHGVKMHNIPHPYFHQRVTGDLFKRRGGLKYLKTIHGIYKSFLKIGFYTKFDYVMSIIPYVIICVVPNWARSLIYKKILRRR